MSYVAWCIFLSVCLCGGHADVLWRNGWTDPEDIWGRSHVGPRNHVLDGGQDWTNPLTDVRGGKSAMQPFARLCRTLEWPCCRLVSSLVSCKIHPCDAAFCQHSWTLCLISVHVFVFRLKEWGSWVSPTTLLLHCSFVSSWVNVPQTQVGTVTCHS